MAQIQPIKTNLTIQRKLSIAAGLLSAVAYFISLLAETWGFGGVGKQIVQTFLAANSVINLYFLGSTTQKIAEENKQDEEDK